MIHLQLHQKFWPMGRWGGSCQHREEVWSNRWAQGHHRHHPSGKTAAFKHISSACLLFLFQICLLEIWRGQAWTVVWCFFPETLVFLSFFLLQIHTGTQTNFLTQTASPTQYCLCSSTEWMEQRTWWWQQFWHLANWIQFWFARKIVGLLPLTLIPPLL